MNETEKPVVNDILPVYVRDKGGPVQQATIKSIEDGLKKVQSQYPKFITYLQNEKAYVNAYKLDPDNNSYEMGETTNTQIMGREGPLELHSITIFENYSSINGPKPNDDVSGTVLHELGHMLDSVLEASNAPGLVYSQSVEFETALKRDLEQVQAKDPDLYKILNQNFGPSTAGRSELVANLFAAHFGRKPVNMLTENVVPAKLINSFPNVLQKMNEMSQRKMGIYIFPEATKNATAANTKAQAAQNSNSFFENILNQATGQSATEQSGITPVQSDSELVLQPTDHRSSPWTTTTSSETNQSVQAKTASIEAGGDAQDALSENDQKHAATQGASVSDASSSNHDAIASVSSWLKSWQATDTDLNPQGPNQEDQQQESKPQEDQPQENQEQENKPQENQQQENQEQENKPQENQQQENQQQENQQQENQQQENQQQENQQQEDQDSERQTTHDASTSDASSSNHEAVASVNSWLKSWQSDTTSPNPQNPNQALEEQPQDQQPNQQETQHEEQSTQQQQQSPWQQPPASNDSGAQNFSDMPGTDQQTSTLTNVFGSIAKPSQAPLTGFSDEQGNTLGENPRQQSGSSSDSVLQFQQLQNDSNATQIEEQNEQEERERRDQLEEDATRAANEAAEQNAREQATRAQSLAEEAQALATQPGQADAARALASEAAALANGAEQQVSDSAEAANAESLAESAKQTADQDEDDKQDNTNDNNDNNDNNDSNDGNDASNNDGDNTSDNTNDNSNDDDSQQSNTSDDSESDSTGDSNDQSSESSTNDSSDESTESSDD
ncbi:MAG TPA: hypothetical protein V6C86_26625 [Oculatellaceae cyanobacterium]